MMLSWLGEQRKEQGLFDAGSAIAKAVDTVLDDPSKRTRDLGGSINTDQFGAHVASCIEA